VNPRLSSGWLDYSTHAKFATDHARVRSPQDYPEDSVIPSSALFLRLGAVFGGYSSG
jgi:hypothetical protein